MDIEDWDALPAGDAKATQRRLLIPMAEDGMPVANQQHAQALVQAGTARYHESDDEDDVSQRMKGKRRARDGAAIADERFRSHDATASPGSAITSSFLIPSTTERSRSDARLPSRRRPPHPPSAREATLGSSLGARHLHHGALHDVQVHEDYEYARLLEADQQQERREVERKDHELAKKMQEEENQTRRSLQARSSRRKDSAVKEVGLEVPPTASLKRYFSEDTRPTAGPSGTCEPAAKRVRMQTFEDSDDFELPSDAAWDSGDADASSASAHSARSSSASVKSKSSSVTSRLSTSTSTSASSVSASTSSSASSKRSSNTSFIGFPGPAPAVSASASTAATASTSKAAISARRSPLSHLPEDEKIEAEGPPAAPKKKQPFTDAQPTPGLPYAKEAHGGYDADDLDEENFGEDGDEGDGIDDGSEAFSLDTGEIEAKESVRREDLSILSLDLEGRYRPEVPSEWSDLHVAAHLVLLGSASTSESDRERFDIFRSVLGTVRQRAQEYGQVWDLVSDLVVLNHVFCRPGSRISYTALPKAEDFRDVGYARALRRVLTVPFPEPEDFDRLAHNGTTGLDEPGHVYARVLSVRVANAHAFITNLHRVIARCPAYLLERAEEIKRALHDARATGKTHLRIPYFGITTISLLDRDRRDKPTLAWCQSLEADPNTNLRSSSFSSFWFCLSVANLLSGDDCSRVLYSLVGLPLDVTQRSFTESTLEFLFTAPRHRMRLANVALGGRIPHYSIHPELSAAFGLLKESHTADFQKAWSQLLVLLDQPSFTPGVGGTTCIIKYASEQLHGHISPANQMRDALIGKTQKILAAAASLPSEAYVGASTYLEDDQDIQQVIACGKAAAHGLRLADLARPDGWTRVNAWYTLHPGFASNHQKIQMQYMMWTLSIAMAECIWRSLQSKCTVATTLAEMVEESLHAAQAQADELVRSDVDWSLRSGMPLVMRTHLERARLATELKCQSSRDAIISHELGERLVNNLRKRLLVAGDGYPSEFRRLDSGILEHGHSDVVREMQHGPAISFSIAVVFQSASLERTWVTVAAPVVHDEPPWQAGDEVELWPVLNETGHLDFYGRRKATRAQVHKLTRKRATKRNFSWLYSHCPKLLECIRAAGIKFQSLESTTPAATKHHELLHTMAFETAEPGLAFGPQNIQQVHPVEIGDIRWNLGETGTRTGRQIGFTAICGSSLDWGTVQPPSLWMNAAWVQAKAGDTIYLVFVITARGTLKFYQVLDDGRRVPIEDFPPMIWGKLPEPVRAALSELADAGHWRRGEPETNSAGRSGYPASDGLSFNDDERRLLIRLANDNRKDNKLRSRDWPKILRLFHRETDGPQRTQPRLKNFFFNLKTDQKVKGSEHVLKYGKIDD